MPNSEVPRYHQDDNSFESSVLQAAFKGIIQWERTSNDARYERFREVGLQRYPW